MIATTYFKYGGSNAWLVCTNEGTGENIIHALRAIIEMCQVQTHTISYDSRLYETQTRLQKLGFDPGPADGVLGNRTREALRRFQRDAGLPAVNGEPDEETMEKLAFHFPTEKEWHPTVPKGIYLKVGDLAATGKVEAGGTFRPTGKIQQFYISNVGDRRLGKLKSTILLYDVAAKQIGTLTEQSEDDGLYRV